MAGTFISLYMADSPQVITTSELQRSPHVWFHCSGMVIDCGKVGRSHFTTNLRTNTVPTIWGKFGENGCSRSWDDGIMGH